MADDSFSILARAGIAEDDARKVVSDALDGTEDGELYLEYSQSEGLTYDNGRLASASFDSRQGFGLRAVSGEEEGTLVGGK